MTADLWQVVVRGYVEKIQANLAAEIVTENNLAAQQTDGTQQYLLNANVNVLDYIPPLTQMNFPCIGIQDARAITEDDTGFTATGVYTHVLTVFHTDPDPRGLAWRLRRYASALYRAVLLGAPNHAMGVGEAWILTFDGALPGPTLNPPSYTTQTTTGLTGGPQEVFSWMGLRFIAKRDEE